MLKVWKLHKKADYEYRMQRLYVLWAWMLTSEARVGCQSKAIATTHIFLVGYLAKIHISVLLAWIQNEDLKGKIQKFSRGYCPGYPQGGLPRTSHSYTSITFSSGSIPGAIIYLCILPYCAKVNFQIKVWPLHFSGLIGCPVLNHGINFIHQSGQIAFNDIISFFRSWSLFWSISAHSYVRGHHSANTFFCRLKWNNGQDKGCGQPLRSLQKTIITR